ncbi:MAG: type II toxin-antitoxin system RelE/ParE family toxin [Tagaea sp.]
MKLRWTDIANEDLDRLYRFRLGSSPDVADAVAAQAVIVGLRAAAKRLLDFPMSAPAYGALRRMVWGPYAVYYRVSDDAIMILRVRHGKEEPLDSDGGG